MLLRKGNYDAAIAKFTLANQKGPHFADPLEMWGEALMRKNRSDLALANFAEANKYAPNWGRLHLKWGEALF
jgi:tetratricopeptide (TPR) repeat protein